MPGRLTPIRQLFWAWVPLAASWLLIGAELPMVTVFLSRSSHPELSLAAFGGLLWPIMLFIDSPGFMLLSAGTALSKSREDFRVLQLFTILLSTLLLFVLLLVILTPLYEVVTSSIIGAPRKLRELAWSGFLFAIPWPFAVSYRRFCQGVLIRKGKSKTVGIGTLLRLLGVVVVLIGGFLFAKEHGVAVAVAAVTVGLLLEAAFVHFFATIVSNECLPETSSDPQTLRSVALFYLPLALTSIMMLANPPIGSTAVFRLPFSIESAAAWSAVIGFVFLFQSGSIALREVVLAALSEGAEQKTLHTFVLSIGCISSALLLGIAISPIGYFWFSTVNSFPVPLARFAYAALLLAVPMPLLSALQCWFQASVIHQRRNRLIPQSILVHLVILLGVLSFSVIFVPVNGLAAFLVALQMGTCGQIVYLWLRARLVNH